MGDHEKKVLHRLKIAKGHLQKVIDMVEKREYCLDVIQQSQAVQSALSKADEAILENHLKTCASESIKKCESKKDIAEIMQILEKKQI